MKAYSKRGTNIGFSSHLSLRPDSVDTFRISFNFLLLAILNVSLLCSSFVMSFLTTGELYLPKPCQVFFESVTASLNCLFVLYQYFAAWVAHHSGVQSFLPCQYCRDKSVLRLRQRLFQYFTYRSFLFALFINSLSVCYD